MHNKILKQIILDLWLMFLDSPRGVDSVSNGPLQWVVFSTIGSLCSPVGDDRARVPGRTIGVRRPAVPRHPLKHDAPGLLRPKNIDVSS